jgi:hypothetical protein
MASFMTTIKTTKGAIEISTISPALLKELQTLLPYGVFPFEQPIQGANFGFVMQYADKEVPCIKLQPIDLAGMPAQEQFLLQHHMIMRAYCSYIKMGFSGVYLATPYLKPKEKGLYEAGIAHFIFPDGDSSQLTSPLNRAYDADLGAGASALFFGFMECYKKAFKDNKLTIPQYFGIDIRPRSHLNSMAMYFMVKDAQLICLRANLREDADLAWPILAEAGITTVFHLPSLPMTIKESDLKSCKGD